MTKEGEHSPIDAEERTALRAASRFREAIALGVFSQLPGFAMAQA